MAEPIRLNRLVGPAPRGRQDAARVLNGDARDAAITKPKDMFDRAEPGLPTRGAHQGARLDALMIGTVAIGPFGGASQIRAIRMEDGKVPALTEDGQHVALQVKRAAIPRRHEIARPRVMPARAECLAHVAELLVTDKDPHAGASPRSSAY